MEYTNQELLNFALQNGIIDLALVQNEKEMHDRKKILEKHPYSIYEGKDKNWYTYLPDEKTGRRKVKATSQEKIENRVVDYWKEQAENPTVSDVFYDWVNSKLDYGEISRASYDRYTIDFEKYFKDVKDKKIKTIAEDFFDGFIKETIRDFELTPKAYSNFRTLIYGIFKYAKRKKYVSYSITYVVKDIEISKKTFKRTVKMASDQVYLPDEKDTMEEYLIENDDIVNLGLLFMFKTGVRVGELATLKRKDVDNYTVAINATETRYKDDNGKAHYDVKDFPKSEAGLRFAILPEQYEWILDKILELNPSGYYLFERQGRRVKTYSFRRRLRYICEDKIHMKAKSPHKVRKTYGTLLLDGNVRESTVLDTMGHTDIACTKGHYYYDRSSIEDKRKELGMVQGL